MKFTTITADMKETTEDDERGEVTQKAVIGFSSF